MDPSCDTHPAATFKTPKNPQATFEGIPAELRVMIHELASRSTIIHVHMHKPDHTPITDIFDIFDEQVKWYWTPCRGTNPKTPLLCANPKWSGMCKEEERCTYKLAAPPEPRGFWALIACNKAIRREAKAPCLRSTVISIRSALLENWISHLSTYAPSQIEQIRRVTLAGPDLLYIGNDAMESLEKNFPNLEGVGYQCHSSFHNNWTKQWRDGQWVISLLAPRDWANLKWTSHFDSSVDMVFEALVWRDPTELLLHEPQRPERMTAIRVFAQGTRDVRDIGTLRDMEIWWPKEVINCSPLPEPQNKAMWRYWWFPDALRITDFR